MEYRFHDYRADGIDAQLLHTFIAELGWEALLNTRGTTSASLMPLCATPSPTPMPPWH